jgi:hypothetical protein
VFFVAIRTQQLEAVSYRPLLVPFFILLTICPETYSVFAHNTHFRGPVTGNPASYSGRPAIKSQPEEQLSNRHLMLLLRLSQQNSTHYLTLHHCDRRLHILSCSLFNNTKPELLIALLYFPMVQQPLWARASSLSRRHEMRKTWDVQNFRTFRSTESFGMDIHSREGQN